MIKLLTLSTCLALIVLTILLFPFRFNNKNIAHAQTCTSSNLNQGLISALSVSGGGSIGNIDQTCVYDAQAAYRDFKVPSYEELETQFYISSTSPAKRSDQLIGSDLNFSGNGIYLQKNSLTLNSAGPQTGGGVQVIFIKGNLNITGNITYADTDPYSGLVFIVSGDININSDVTQVNAVLISHSRICTAYLVSSCLDGSTITPQLVVNGSLISLNRTNLPSGDSAIKLVRNLAINNQPAEVINKQAKYLYILKDGLFTKDLILIQEDKSYDITPNPGGTPPPPPPAATTCQGANPLAILSNPDFKDVTNCIIGI